MQAAGGIECSKQWHAAIDLNAAQNSGADVVGARAQCETLAFMRVEETSGVVVEDAAKQEKLNNDAKQIKSFLIRGPLYLIK